MILIAIWHEPEDVSLPPSLVYWANGDPATREDYWKHLRYTSISFISPDRKLLQLFLPGLSGATFYDASERVWKVRPEGEVFSLFANDPLADDHPLLGEIAMCPIAYRPKIERPKAAHTQE